MINHANRFFKEIKKLQDALEKVQEHKWGEDAMEDDGVSIWPLGNSHDCAPDECFKRSDGLWETPPEMYGRKVRKYVFIWRYHKNYCCAGQPYYNTADVANFLKNSETEKVLYEHDGYEFVWAWDEVRMPTRISWGMFPQGFHYQLRKNDEILVKTDVKKHFREAVSDYL